MATIADTLLIPAFRRSFSRAVERFQVHRSLPRLLLHIFSCGGINYMHDGAQVALVPAALLIVKVAELI